MSDLHFSYPILMMIIGGALFFTSVTTVYLLYQLIKDLREKKLW